MAHFAILNNDNIVQHVLVVSNDIATSEQAGISFLQQVYNDSNLKIVQTSYNTRGGIHYASDNSTPDGGIALRANYAGIGYTYDPVNDVFYAPQPYPSWIISAPTWIWNAPTSIPTTPTPEGQFYVWDETTQSWVESV